MRSWFRSLRHRFPISESGIRRMHIGVEIAQFALAVVSLAALIFIWRKEKGRKS